MRSDNLEALKKWCKDEESFSKVKELFKEVTDERDKYIKKLSLLESAIESDYDSIIVTELTLEKPGPQIVYANDGFCEMTGYSKNEVIGKTPRILQGPKTDQETLDNLKKELKEGQSFFGKAVNYRKDGSEFINQWDIHPITDDDGNVTHWVSYQRDISKRKEAERRLMDHKIKFDDLDEASKRIVLDLDTEGNIVMANKLFRCLSGYNKGELDDKKIWDLYSDDKKSKVEAQFQESDPLQVFQDKSFKDVIKHRDGSCLQIKGSTKVMDLKKQTIIRATIENVSLQKRIKKTLEGNCVENSRKMAK